MAKPVKAFLKQLLHEITHKPGFTERGIKVLGNACGGDEEKSKRDIARMQSEENRNHTGMLVVEKHTSKKSRLINPFHWPTIGIGAVRTFLCGLVDALECRTPVTYPSKKSHWLTMILKGIISGAIGLVELPVFLICSKGFGRIVDALIDCCAGNEDLVVDKIQGTTITCVREKKLKRSNSTPHLGERNKTVVDLRNLISEAEHAPASENPETLPGVVPSQQTIAAPAELKTGDRSQSKLHARTRSKTLSDLTKQGVDVAELLRQFSKASRESRQESKHSRATSASSVESEIQDRINEAELNAARAKAQSRFSLEASKLSNASHSSQETPKSKAPAKRTSTYSVGIRRSQLKVSGVAANEQEPHAARAFDFAVNRKS